ncbi:IclR family transcriptional regulator [Paenibacillus macerans]|uniref:IclR family transcriptional regulator n=1 Tax=Paenibacillus macerans TaxID=44252 RepID=UPI003D318F78
MNEVGTLKKGIDILWLIIEKGSLSVLEIMEMLSLNRSTTYRLVNTLEQNHLIEKNSDSTYSVSGQLIQSLQDNSFNFDLDSSILRVSDEFRELTGETVFIGILSGAHVIATHIIPGRYATRTHYERGDKLPAYQSAIGKCILAFQPPNIQEQYIANLSDEQNASFTMLEQVKSAGFSIDNEETEPGVRCIAAPIWRAGRVAAAVAISGPSVRVSREMDEENSKLVRRFSHQISAALTER